MTEKSSSEREVKEEKNAEGKTRLAVLGGGPSALSALYYITNDPEVNAKYDITVYQMGWRLGGKGASGRGEKYGEIYEHGLHILFGFYDNFFSMIRAIYSEMGRKPEQPLATWEEAFVPHNFGVVEEQFKGKWHPWALDFPTNESVPGDGGPLDTERDYLSMFGQALIELIFGWRELHREQENGEFKLFSTENDRIEHKKQWSDPLVNLLMRALEWPLKRALKHPSQEKRRRIMRRHTGWFHKILWSLILRWSNKSMASHRFWLGVDFLLAVIKGIIDDEVYEKGGFNSIDKYDFREWLVIHGVHKITLPSPYCRTIYDAAFSYQDGDSDKQRVAAGAALRALYRMGFTYKGSAYYKMQAGMGDTVFTPMYLILKKRGVKFKFFHKIESLHLSPKTDDGKQRSIASISLTQQAFLSSGNAEDYQPLKEWVDLQCWPQKPLYDQLDYAVDLQKHDLESYYDKLPLKITQSLTLEEGKDYDQVLYGIPIGAVPYVCEELVQDSPHWANMVEHVQSVTTVVFQLWLKEDLKGLGWTMPVPLLSLYEQPLNTWSDMSQVIVREDWPKDESPKQISYYCGAQQGPEKSPDPRLPENASFEKDQYAEAKRLSLEYCQKYLTTLLPGAANPKKPVELNWDLLVDPQNRQGEARFDNQYWRSNCGPSERCTLALPGSTQYRMKADDTGYANLVITGDWIDNGLYVACMEGAVQGGIYGARAVTGINYPIIGEELDEM